MQTQRELRDPIHGFIQRAELEEKLIDTSVFQRLRGIKQLALANLVYPGANHTRFSHSIGVMHVAGRLANQLFAGQEQGVVSEKIRLVRLAALLHDIGHGPFSHVAEEILDEYYDGSKVKPVNQEKIHEFITWQIIEQNKELAEFLSPAERDKIINLLRGVGVDSVTRGIVSGPLDADKQDYLLRDSYFCGVKYGVFDIERLIGTLCIYTDQFDQFLAASEGGVYAVEQFVIAKYHMATQVYRHKVRLITDSMITRAFQLGIEADRLGWLKKLFSYDGSADFIENYLTWDDARVTTALLYPLEKGGHATELFWRLRNRKLFKRVYSRRIIEFEDPITRKILLDRMKEKGFRAKLEQEIADFLTVETGTAVPKEYVVLKEFAIKSVKEQSRDSEGSIIVLEGDRIPKSFEEISTLFHSINEKESDRFIEVFAPMKYDGELDKRKKQVLFAEGISKILKKSVDSQAEFDYKEAKKTR
jgi:HD superfamily phosphohydrolase